MTALVVIMGVAVLLLGVLVAGLLRSHADILRALHDLGVGEDGRAGGRALRTQPGVATPRQDAPPAVDLTGTKLDGTARHIAVTGTDHATLLAFMSSGCTTCAAFWKEFSRNADLQLPGTDTRLVIVTKSLEHESEAALASLAPPHIPLVMSSTAWEDFAIPVSPYFILVDGASGRIAGEGSATSWRQVRSLLTQAMADSEAATTRRRNDGDAREQRADEQLRRAGIEPGHPSLYPDGAPEAGDGA